MKAEYWVAYYDNGDRGGFLTTPENVEISKKFDESEDGFLYFELENTYEGVSWCDISTQHNVYMKYEPYIPFEDCDCEFCIKE